MRAQSGQAPRTRAVDAVLLLDKPAGMTSQTAVTAVKKLFNAAKAGHTGTLDPMATGLLPVALGEATKFSSVLLDASKGYLATIRLGTTTTTGDLEGEVKETRAVVVEPDQIERVLARFRGEIVQTPPMYSALKHAGKPLYRYAREGKEIAREARLITITRLTLEAMRGMDLEVTVECSKGTYVRVLAEDIGSALGCGACLAALKRIRVGGFGVSEAVGLDALAAMSATERERCLLPVDALLADVPSLGLDPDEANHIMNGRAIDCQRAPHGTLVRLYGPDRIFLGLAHASAAGQVQPRRLVAQKSANS